MPIPSDEMCNPETAKPLHVCDSLLKPSAEHTILQEAAGKIIKRLCDARCEALENILVAAVVGQKLELVETRSGDGNATTYKFVFREYTSELAGDVADLLESLSTGVGAMETELSAHEPSSCQLDQCIVTQVVLLDRLRDGVAVLQRNLAEYENKITFLQQDRERLEWQAKHSEYSFWYSVSAGGQWLVTVEEPTGGRLTLPTMYSSFRAAVDDIMEAHP